jgi:hypothetical protein
MKTCVKIIQNNVNGKQKQGESNDSVNFWPSSEGSNYIYLRPLVHCVITNYRSMFM